MALLDNRTVETWGDNSRGQLGDDSHENYSDVPVPVCAKGQTSCTSSEHELTGVVAIAAGETNDLALLENGTFVGWGDNQWGDLGTGQHNGPEACVTGACSRVPVLVKGITGKGKDFATAIASESRHSLALLKNETVMAWGSNDDSQLGDGSEKGPEECELVSGAKEACSVNPVPVSGLAEVRAIAAGYASLALLANGTVKSWGRNDHGELGIGTFGGDSDVPVPVSGLHEVSIISDGYEHSLALGVG
jgi:alpha-tubulin suppressor-like RCC1 family protein